MPTSTNAPHSDLCTPQNKDMIFVCEYDVRLHSENVTLETIFVHKQPVVNLKTEGLAGHVFMKHRCVSG